MLKIYINDKNIDYPQYEFKIIKLNLKFETIVHLYKYLLKNYPKDFDNYMCYEFYKIDDIKNFKWEWHYLNTIQPLMQIRENENIENLTDIYIHYHHSQHNEDSIIKRIFDNVKCTNKVFVDVGSKNGKFISNVYNLIKQDWFGLLIDPEAPESGDPKSHSGEKLRFIKTYATPSNFQSLLDSNTIPLDFDFLNIDIDGNDIHVLESILNKYKPKLICIEADARNDHYKNERFFEYDFKNNLYKQASILSIMKRIKDKYDLVYNNGGNCFFIEKSCNNLKKMERSEIINNIQKNIKKITSAESNITTNEKDKNSRLNRLNEYIKNEFEDFYPFIFRYELNTNT